MNEDYEVGVLLKKIGSQLDQGQYPRIYNNGIVQPGDTFVVSSIPGEVNTDGSKRPRRSKTRSWNGAAGGQRETSRPWAASQTSQVFSADLRDAYEEEISVIQNVYPETVIWRQEEGLWLLSESKLLLGLDKKATFLTAIPYSKNVAQKSWGFWSTAISDEWIGPRHTNFPDGSICAFDPKDKTWMAGESIVKLLDLYTLWAFRHEYLKHYGRWPGHQSVPLVYERLNELKDDEYCGCENSTLLYSECCKQHDHNQSVIQSLLEFMRFTRGNIHRHPPREIIDTMKHRRSPPSMEGLLY